MKDTVIQIRVEENGHKEIHAEGDGNAVKDGIAYAVAMVCIDQSKDQHFPSDLIMSEIVGMASGYIQLITAKEQSNDTNGD